MTDDEIALVLALVRQHVAQTARTWVVSHVQVRGKRKREVLTWDGIRTPPTYTHVDCYQRWLPGRKKILRSLTIALVHVKYLRTPTNLETPPQQTLCPTLRLP